MAADGAHAVHAMPALDELEFVVPYLLQTRGHCWLEAYASKIGGDRSIGVD